MRLKTDIQELGCEILREIVGEVLVHKVEKEAVIENSEVIFNGLEGIDLHQ